MTLSPYHDLVAVALLLCASGLAGAAAAAVLWRWLSGRLPK